MCCDLPTTVFMFFFDVSWTVVTHLSSFCNRPNINSPMMMMMMMMMSALTLLAGSKEGIQPVKLLCLFLKVLLRGRTKPNLE